MSKPPLTIYAVIQSDGFVAGAWKDRATAEHVRSKGRPGDRVAEFSEVIAQQDPLGEALNSGDGSYKP